MTASNDDHDDASGLSRDEAARLAALLRASTPGSPPALDTAILAAAEAALAREQRLSLRKRRITQWSLAASVTLVAGLGWRLQQEVPAPAVPVVASAPDAPADVAAVESSATAYLPAVRAVAPVQPEQQAPIRKAAGSSPQGASSGSNEASPVAVTAASPAAAEADRSPAPHVPAAVPANAADVERTKPMPAAAIGPPPPATAALAARESSASVAAIPAPAAAPAEPARVVAGAAPSSLGPAAAAPTPSADPQALRARLLALPDRARFIAPAIAPSALAKRAATPTAADTPASSSANADKSAIEAASPQALTPAELAGQLVQNPDVQALRERLQGWRLRLPDGRELEALDWLDGRVR